MALSRLAGNKALNSYAENIIETAGIIDDQTTEVLMRSIMSVPRGPFIAEGYHRHIYDDIALPIGYGQMVYKPSMIIRMISLIGVRPNTKVLHIGAGSGYTSAIMSSAGADVFAIESVGLLAQKTRKVLDSINFQKIIVKRADGRKGWSEHAPYDAILVTTVIPNIEPVLLSQLKSPGGKMVALIGDNNSQVLTYWEARLGGVNMYQLEACNVETLSH